MRPWSRGNRPDFTGKPHGSSVKEHMSQRIEVITLSEDGRAQVLEQNFARAGKSVSAKIVDVYTVENDLGSPANLDALSKSFVNPVTQKLLSKGDEGDFDWAVEIGFLPGVTDNIGHTVSELAAFTLNDNQPVYSSQVILLKGDVSENDVKALSASLYNPLIQRAAFKDKSAYQKDGGMDVVVPKVRLDNKGITVDDVDLNISDEELAAIGKDGIKNADGTRRGPLGMSPLYMQAVQAYFKKLGRLAKDIEIETLAQTWSEHCKHTIFASPIDDVKGGLYKHYIKRATQEIRESRGKDDICVSVFKDNSGGIVFDDKWLITDKVETHNSPSALDPFGGAITGIVGVNRDCVGFGQGAKPVLNRYGFCLADPNSNPEFYRGKGKMNKALSPAAIMKGVIHGVNHGGNCSGIPTPQGFLYFDDRYAGKPLVFAGTVGLIPREINGKPAHIKGAQVGDCDPITQKKFSDAIVKEIRDLGLYNAITDNGAGGLSSSVGEMGGDTNGFTVELDKVPLKYPGMQPWEIWISESQERMTLAVPPKNIEKLQAMLAKRGSESWVIGTFNDGGKCHVTWHGETVMDIDMDFLHDGVPETPLKTSFTRGGASEPKLSEPKNYDITLRAMLGRLNICSKEFVAAQYDHNVQGSAVLGPLQGKGRVFAEATVSRPVLTSPRGVVLSQGLAPLYSDIDTYHMASASLDIAVRNAVAAGCPIDHLAILDNFCWCSSEDPERLGQLKRACEAIYDLAVVYQTPFISGKDSMFNDFKGYDANDKPMKISIPPTLLVSGIGVMENVDQSVSLDPKMKGDSVYILGTTKDELGASEYYALNGELGNNVPETDARANLALYKKISEANKARLIASALPVTLGGAGVALAKKCIASGLGMDIEIKTDMRLDTFLFSESTGRVIVTVGPKDIDAFEKLFGASATKIGTMTDKATLIINGHSSKLADLETAYKQPLKDF
ncbi:MAG: phosphoribosylformylglycinamidine synthase [Micavibrio aeruginosavorus]|uniref:Phosphoribosylformylglycinamidine synthase subunit PurL n=1 Tax=Micavibrio aeruginosavorus TaxID=349221 RepID=A0A2W5MW92_9BACT|nr:MAG: phosphoribosylformylglycinamidine synthase [Micavibrio aeruginosavorus]